MDAVREKIDTIATKVVDYLISSFLDDDFFGSQRDPHGYAQTVISIWWNDDSIVDMAVTVEEITRMVDHKDKLSYTSRLDENVAMEVVDKIQTILTKLMRTMHDCKFFQEPYTKAEVSSIFQNHFLKQSKFYRN